MNIEVWSDVVCPWCYLGKRRLERALDSFEPPARPQVVYRSFQLDPSAPADRTVDTAEMLAAKYGMPPDRVDALQRQMEQRAAAEGLEYHLDGQRSGSTADAHRLLHLARERGQQDAVAEALFRAHFTDGRSIFDPASLQAVAVEAGLSEPEVAELLAGDRYTDAVAADLAQARAYGITGVPFFVLDGRLGVSGAQSAEVLREVVEQALATAG